MPRQLPADCLNEVFEYLENEITLYSCLLVNRLWCEIAVRILWRDVLSFKHNDASYREKILSRILSTLIACLPNESRDLLRKNGIIITTSPPLFNYASFCKVLLVHEIDKTIQHFLEKQQPITFQSLNYKRYLLLQEILKMFMKEISSLKFLDYDSEYSNKIQNVMFTNSPEARNCLKDLLELKCCSDIYSEFFYQISQICHNIQSLTIGLGNVVSSGLADLISLQNNLKSLTLINYYYDCGSGSELEAITSLTNFSLTLTKLKIEEYYLPLSFIATFTNLEELILSFEHYSGFDGFNQLQYVTFPHLKILKFLFECPKVEMLIKFLEFNGKNLKELYLGDNDNSLNLAVAKFCLNLKILFTIFAEEEIETLKIILTSCQYLESITVWCSDVYLNDKELLKVLENFSPKNFYELKLDYVKNESKILPEDLESFFINWKNKVPLSLIIVKNSDMRIGLEMNEENMKVIERYMKMGFIKYGKGS